MNILKVHNDQTSAFPSRMVVTPKMGLLREFYEIILRMVMLEVAEGSRVYSFTRPTTGGKCLGQ